MSIQARRTIAAAGGLALVAAGTLAGAPAGAAGTDDSPQHHRRLEANLRPSGDPDGSGEAHLTLNKARKRVCATITWEHIDSPDAAHIHRGSDGSIVVDLTGSVTGGSRCATGVSKRTIGALQRHPGRYYVNVHNPTYPAGAIQGTLRH